jgi:hypothetical protein
LVVGTVLEKAQIVRAHQVVQVAVLTIKELQVVLVHQAKVIMVEMEVQDLMVEVAAAVKVLLVVMPLIAPITVVMEEHLPIPALAELQQLMLVVEEEEHIHLVLLALAAALVQETEVEVVQTEQMQVPQIEALVAEVEMVEVLPEEEMDQVV